MRYFLSTVFVCFVTACGDSNLGLQKPHDKRDTPPLLSTEPGNMAVGNGAKKDTVNEETEPLITLHIDGHAVIVSKQGEVLHVESVPEVITSRIKLSEFLKPLPIRNVVSLKQNCSNSRYKEIRHQSITGIVGWVGLNPFSDAKIRSALNTIQSVSFATTIIGAFKADRGFTRVEALYLTATEIDRIEKWFDGWFIMDHSLAQFQILALGDDLDHLIYPVPIMEFGRLICGILDGEAKLSFVLTDQNGRTLTTIIDGIEFGQ